MRLSYLNGNFYLRIKPEDNADELTKGCRFQVTDSHILLKREKGAPKGFKDTTGHIFVASAVKGKEILKNFGSQTVIPEKEGSEWRIPIDSIDYEVKARPKTAVKAKRQKKQKTVESPVSSSDLLAPVGVELLAESVPNLRHAVGLINDIKKAHGDDVLLDVGNDGLLKLKFEIG
jgi:hypothetical protein